ncbi:MAG: TetR/AcrR family transcriptional regulator [Oligoflexia bacterium]|nr:TetR/AcrR family transcriptional regulator [Oligoflexia bacterium]
MDEFLERGFAGSTMAGLAERARLAKGTLYLYFQTKEALFSGVVRDIVSNPLSDSESQPILPGERVGDYLRRTLLPVMRQMEKTGRASIARVVMAEGAQFPFLGDVYREGAYEPLLAHIRSCARLALSRGELKDDALARYPHLLVAPLWGGIIHNAMIDQRHPVDVGDLFEAQLNTYFPK